MYVTKPGDSLDWRGLACPAVVASLPQADFDLFSGAAVCFSSSNIEVLFTNQNKEIVHKECFPLQS